MAWGTPRSRASSRWRRVCRTGAGRHIARVLLVPRRIGDDELAPRRGEVTVRDVDGDALLALRFEAVRKEREVDLADAASHRCALDRRKLVLLDRARIVEQPPDERALAVVDAARRDETQHAAVHVLAALDFAEQRHQKYPSRLRRSIDASEVWSSMRVAPRSVSVASIVSATISSTLAAVDATGQVQLTSPTVRKRTERSSTVSSARGGVSGVIGTSSPRRRTTARRCA